MKNNLWLSKPFLGCKETKCAATFEKYPQNCYIIKIRTYIGKIGPIEPNKAIQNRCQTVKAHSVGRTWKYEGNADRSRLRTFGKHF